ncbi:NHL repeat-containing protein 2-like isoform X2 [Mya arenaria]|uniref:NHL repeat-containing protein 2-like isoform X2 n=1 Tax=Mya arenaria TaxID=6604 RepID=UPI0022E7E273|nr:NHL repeat-containing protein 2-like isoform X2 [Mya arenaria]
MIELADIQCQCYELDEKLATSLDQAEEEIRKHLSLVESKLKYTVPQFPKDAEWLNTSGPLSLEQHLRGKIAVLDFFTYCCVNCMHILPDLEALEEKYPIKDGVAVVGVHSAKFENEKVTSNILSAVLRYNIHHPVINDKTGALWGQLQIACWPTLVIVGPQGQFLYQIVGEGHRERLMQFVNVAKEFYQARGELSDHNLPLDVVLPPDSPLSFPGKVCVSEDGRHIAISDTGHHRILVTDSAGIVKHVIGSSSRGFTDGSFSETTFASPQGLVFHGNDLYIADTNNHAIRKAALETQEVVTVAGTGSQGSDKIGGETGLKQEIASPWDLELVDGLGGEKDALLMMAMAGNHQMWTYFLADATWLKNTHHPAGTCLRFSGSGLEENRNNSYPEKAGFAQPSGLTVSRKNACLFVADSESSSIRRVQLKDGSVKNVVGGDIDPNNLFAYGDTDGVGTKAGLQHPLGVAMATDDGPLYVADSYNHKIKVVDIAKRNCSTLIGSGKPGNAKGANLLQWELNEPGGVTCDVKNKRLYIADTNNCDIKVLDLKNETLLSLPILFTSESQKSSEVRILCTKPVTMSTKEGIPVTLDISLAEGVHLNEEAPNSWTIYFEDESLQKELAICGTTMTGELTQALQQTLLQLPAQIVSIGGELCLKLDLYICDDAGMCKMAKEVLKQKLNSSEMKFHLSLS